MEEAGFIRSTRRAGLFEKRGVSLISVAESLDTATAAGRLVITIMGAVSQWEREAIGERTRDALRHKRAQGHRTGNIPFGYRLAADGRTLAPDATEQEAMTEIRALRKQGLSLRAVADVANQKGHRTRRGTGWRLESVVRVLRQTHRSIRNRIQLDYRGHRSDEWSERRQ